jgi:hypothetical protein
MNLAVFFGFGQNQLFRLWQDFEEYSISSLNKSFHDCLEDNRLVFNDVLAWELIVWSETFSLLSALPQVVITTKDRSLFVDH